MALASSAADKAAAQTLFDEGRALVEKGEWERACPKFAESQRLDPAGGTQINLARCYEKTGQTASAWGLFMEVAAAARNAGRTRRAEEASRRADQLKPMLSTVLIEVDQPVDGIVVKRGDDSVSEAQWGTAVPVDPGTYEIVATAPGKKPWKKTVEVKAQADAVTITVPELEAAPAEDTATGGETTGGGTTTAPPDDVSEGDGQWIAGWVVGGVGVAGAAVGVALRVVALSKDDESRSYCLPEDETRCTQEGVDLREEARGLQLGSIIAWAVGGAAIATGVILLVTTPSSDESGADEAASLELLPMAGPGGGGALLRGTF